VQGSRFRRSGDPSGDISVVGSLRAAAPFQRARGAEGRPAILPDDLRLRKRSRKTGMALVMVVDSSSSMRTNNRMSVTKGAIETLLEDLYLRRDKLGIITFRNTGAEVVLPLTSNMRDAMEGIEKLPVGGRTPLAAGIEMGTRLLVQEKRKNPEALPAMLLFSDGNPNVSSFGGDPLEETYFHARELKRLGIRSIWVDMEFNPMSTGCGFEIAQAMGATYLTLDRLRR
jgi:magnesium chelatase subunit D